MRRRLRRSLIAWLAASGLGSAILALPEEGPRVFSISDTHGPSLLDLGGILIIVVVWGVFAVELVRARRFVPLKWPLLVIFTVGAGLTGWSVATDSGQWWVLGVVLLVLVQIGAAAGALRTVAYPAEALEVKPDGLTN